VPPLSRNVERAKMISGEFEQQVLGWVTDDYEAPHTIAGDISRELGRPVAEAEVLEALASLARAGFVQAFAFDRKSWRYVPIDVSALLEQEDPWFYTTPTGRALFRDAR
jgi:hypothetical protein